LSDNQDGPANYAHCTWEEAKDKFEKYMDDCIKFRTGRLGKGFGEQVKDFVTWLGKKTKWYDAPASTKYHLAVPGGLLIHSVGVTDTALTLRRALMPDLPVDSVIFCAMFHDVGKIYAKVAEDGTGRIISRYEPNILKGTGRLSDKVPFHYTSEGDNGIHMTIKDAMLPLKFVDLSDCEIQALMNADGQYVPINKTLQHKETPLACIIHWADFWNGHVVEGQIGVDYLSGILGVQTPEGA